MRGIYLGDARPVPSQHGHMSLTGSYSGFVNFGKGWLLISQSPVFGENQVNRDKKPI